MEHNIFDTSEIIPGLFFLFILTGPAWIFFSIYKKGAVNRKKISLFENQVKLGDSVSLLIESAIWYGCTEIDVYSESAWAEFKIPDSSLKLSAALEKMTTCSISLNGAGQFR